MKAVRDGGGVGFERSVCTEGVDIRVVEGYCRWALELHLNTCCKRVELRFEKCGGQGDSGRKTLRNSKGGLEESIERGCGQLRIWWKKED